MYKYLLVAFLSVFILNIKPVVSQTTGDSAPGGTAPTGGSGQIPSPQDFPEYIITPSEDLNQLENTRVKKTKTDYRQGQSSLNKPLSQKSNAEVNAEIDKRRAEREKALEEENAALEASAQEKPATEDSAGSDDSTAGFDTPGTSTLFRWTDKDGILHVTDDLGSVPPEYRDQAYNRK